MAFDRLVFVLTSLYVAIRSQDVTSSVPRLEVEPTTGKDGLELVENGTEMSGRGEREREDFENFLFDMKKVCHDLSTKMAGTEKREDWVLNGGVMLPSNSSCVTKQEVEEQFADLNLQLLAVLRLLKDLRIYAAKAEDCSRLYAMGVREDGAYTIYPNSGVGISAYCDMTTDGGGWTVLQRRFDGSVDFYRGWEEYAQGFGDVDGEHWLGLRHVHKLTLTRQTQLYVRVDEYDWGSYSATYNRFSVAPEGSKFRLNIGAYSGNAGNGFSTHNGIPFSTKDRNNRSFPTSVCNNGRHGAWWYSGCTSSDLNGRFSIRKVLGQQSIDWPYAKLGRKTSLMMIRPLYFRH